MSQGNIILIVVDCLRADHVCTPGLAHTPTLDALRRSGFSFSNAISSAPNTTPSFASMLTGRYPCEHGVRSIFDHKLPPDFPTLAESLRAAGHHTYAEVTGPLGRDLGLDRGFDEYTFRERHEGIHTPWGDEFLRRLRGHYRAPWFLLLHVWELHQKRQVLPERENRRFGASQYARALSSIDVFLEKLLAAMPQDTLLILTGDHGEVFPRSRLHRRWMRLGTKWAGFLERVHLRSKLIGPPRCQPGHSYSIYDELLRVPLIFNWPGKVAQGQSDKQVRHVDILPTILDVIGAPGPSETSGASLSGMLRGQPGEHRDAYFEKGGLSFAPEMVRVGLRVENRYKYMFSPFGERRKPELYDLQADPGERRNIIGKRPDVAADLRRRIEALPIRRVPDNTLGEKEKSIVHARLTALGYHD